MLTQPYTPMMENRPMAPSMSSGSLNPQDMFFIMLLNDRLKAYKDPPHTDRANKALMESIEKQNQLLNRLVGNDLDPDLEEKL
jgi:hypothetical protein